jgi:hypothetical protein
MSFLAEVMSLTLILHDISLWPTLPQEEQVDLS